MKQGEVWVDSYKNQGDQNKDRRYSSSRTFNQKYSNFGEQSICCIVAK